jgi:hypothetical protein
MPKSDEPISNQRSTIKRTTTRSMRPRELAAKSGPPQARQNAHPYGNRRPTQPRAPVSIFWRKAVAARLPKVWVLTPYLGCCGGGGLMAGDVVGELARVMEALDKPTLRGGVQAAGSVGRRDAVPDRAARCCLHPGTALRGNSSTASLTVHTRLSAATRPTPDTPSTPERTGNQRPARPPRSRPTTKINQHMAPSHPTGSVD